MSAEKASVAMNTNIPAGVVLKNNVNWRRDIQADIDRGRDDKGRPVKIPIWYRKGLLTPIHDHYAHMDKNGQSKIIYFESDEKGRLERPSMISPGKYLAEFYPKLDQNKIRELSSIVDESYVLSISSDPDVFEHVYETGPDSCMARKNFSKPHPVRAYNSEDWAIAYLTKDDKITHRSMINKKTKEYIREYPSGDAKLPSILHLEGYTKAKDGPIDLRLNINYIDSNTISVPYVDRCRYVILKDNYLIVKNNSSGGGVETSQSGKMEIASCACCSKKRIYSASSGDSSDSSSHVTVSWWGDGAKTVTVCDECMNSTNIYKCQLSERKFWKTSKYIRGVPKVSLSDYASGFRYTYYDKVNYEVFSNLYATCYKTGIVARKSELDFDITVGKFYIDLAKYGKDATTFKKYVGGVVDKGDHFQFE